MELGLNGKNVWITGSSRGIGFAAARCFLEDGSRVVLNGRNWQRLAEARERLEAQYGQDRVFAVPGNMEVREELCRAREFIRGELGFLDVLVGNLGTGKSDSSKALLSEEWQRLLETNLLSQVRLVECFLELLRDSGASNIVFISSIAGREQVGAPPAYAAAKAGLETLVKSLSWKLADRHIRVNAVAPGNILFPGGRWEELLRRDKRGVEEMLRRDVPAGRFGTPEEIARTVVFLASDGSSFTNGSIFVADGGQTRSF